MANMGLGFGFVKPKNRGFRVLTTLDTVWALGKADDLGLLMFLATGWQMLWLGKKGITNKSQRNRR